MSQAIIDELRQEGAGDQQRRGSFRRSSAAHAVLFTSMTRSRFGHHDKMMERKKRAVMQGVQGRISVCYSVSLDALMGNGSRIWAHCSLPDSLLPGFHAHDGLAAPTSKQVEILDRHQIVHPARTIPLLRPGIDKVVLPRDPSVIQYAQFCARIFNLREDQFLWTSGRNLIVDDDIQIEMVRDMVEWIEGHPPQSLFCLVPYSGLLEGSQKWMHKVCEECTNHPVRIMGDHRTSLAEFCQRGILHPHIANPCRFSVCQFLGENQIGRILPGWYCENAEEVRQAVFMLLRECASNCAGLPSASAVREASIVLKPSLGFGHPPVSLGVKDVSDMDRFGDENVQGLLVPSNGLQSSSSIWFDELIADFLELGPVLVQRVDSKRALNKVHVVHSIGKTIIHDIVDVERCKAVGSSSLDDFAIVPCEKDLNFVRRCYCIASSLLTLLRPTGPSEFEFVSSHVLDSSTASGTEEEPVLVDIHMGRFSVGHLIKLFALQIAPGRPFASWTSSPLDSSPDDVWNALCKRGIQLHPIERYCDVMTLGGPQHLKASRASGVFPLCVLRGHYSLYIAFGDSSTHLCNLRKEASSIVDHLPCMSPRHRDRS